MMWNGRIRTLSIDRIKDVIEYNPISGKLFWKKRDGKNSSQFNGQFAHTEALANINEHGYKNGNIFRNHALAHIVCWAMNNEKWPEYGMDIDHINGIRDDNRIKNLRTVSRHGNMKNSKTPLHNTSGVIGVCWDKSKRKWQAKIQVFGKTIHLGRFHDLEAAASARSKAEEFYNFHENHGKIIPAYDILRSSKNRKGPTPPS